MVHFVPNTNLPKPIIFGYNYLVAVETLKEFRKLPEFSMVDSLILRGSSVKPRDESKGKDIDWIIFLKGNISRRQQDKAESKLRGIMANTYRKYGVQFDSLCFPATINDYSTTNALRNIRAGPYKILFARQRSWVKSRLQKMGARPRVAKFHKKTKSGITRFPLPRKPRPR